MQHIRVLNIEETNMMKGIAIIAMLLHHVYGCVPNDYCSPSPIMSFLGEIGKVCVSIFLFCSGYGLSIQYERVVNDWKDENINNTVLSKIIDSLRFMVRRFVKFYAGYWPIFFVFVPIGVFVFNKPLTISYGENVCVIKHVLIDLLGMHGFHSYNITWWFNQLILLLYLIFPLLYILMRRLPFVTLLVSILLMLSLKEISIGKVFGITYWQFPFVMGMELHRFSGIRMEQILNRCPWWPYISILVGLLVVLIVGRVLINCDPRFVGTELDGLLALIVTLCVVLCTNMRSNNNTVLSLLGKHSMNIYLTHTFIFSHWFSSQIYSCEVIQGGAFLALLIVCLTISISLEYLKEKIGYNKLVKKILSKL